MDITIKLRTTKTDTIKAALGYRDEIMDYKTQEMIPNPVTPKAFLKDWISNKINKQVNRYIDNKPENKSDFKASEAE